MAGRPHRADSEGVGDRHPFDAAISLDHSGPFGYTVRAVPRNEALASVAELGLVGGAGLRDGCRQATALEASGFGRRQPQESLHGR